MEIEVNISSDYYNEEMEKMNLLLHKQIPYSTKKYPFKNLDNYNIEEVENELYTQYIGKINPIHQMLIITFLDSMKKHKYTPVDPSEDMPAGERSERHFYLTGLESCIRACKHLIAEENKSSKELDS